MSTTSTDGKEFEVAREEFAEFEKKIGEPEAILHLKAALDYVLDILEAERGKEDDKKKARNLALTYRNLLVRKANELINDTGMFDFETYEYWFSLAMEFSEANLGNDEEFNKAKIDFLRLMIKTLSPADRKKVLENLD